MVAKPSSAATRLPRARDQERRKGSFTSSLRMEPHSRSAKSRKSTKFRAISRSLILCNARMADDSSSPDEKYPEPFEIPLSQGKEGSFHSAVQLADTSEAALASEAAQFQAVGSDRGKNSRKMFFMKVCPRFAGLRSLWLVLELLKVFKSCIQRPGSQGILILYDSKEKVKARPPGMVTKSVVAN